MSLLSQRKYGKNNIFINLTIYEAHLLLNSKRLKNIFPYIISIKFNKNPEKLISPIKKAHEIFNLSKTKFQYFLRNNEQKVFLKINCFSKADFNKLKNIASCIIEIEDLKSNNDINNGNIKKKWYYLKNKNNEKIIKLFMSIELHNSQKVKNNFLKNNFTQCIKTENNIENNLTINKPENINIHLNSITNNNLNIITNNIYMTNLNISLLNETLKSSNTNTIVKKNDNSRNLFINILLENKKKNTNNNAILNNKKFSSFIQNIINIANEKISLKLNAFKKEKEKFENKINDYNEKKTEYLVEKTKYQKEEKIQSNNTQKYENNYLDLNINLDQYQKRVYREEIQKDLNNYEKDVLLNINNILRNNSKTLVNKFAKKVSQKESNKQPKTKLSNCDEKFSQNIHFNNQRYSFESNGKTNSTIYMMKKSKDNIKSNKIILYNIPINKNIININKDNENDTKSENFIISSINLRFKSKKKLEAINISESKSNSPDSEKFGKYRLITDFSRSTLNIEKDFNNCNELQKQYKKKLSKKNILNIEEILNNKTKKKKLFKNKIDINECYNKKFISNSSNNKKMKKKVDINDDNEYNIYYHLENKRKESKFKFYKSNIGDNSIFIQKTDNKYIKSNNQTRNKMITKKIKSQKTENISTNDIANFKKSNKNKQVIKNVINAKSKNFIYNNKSIFSKKEKYNSNITFNLEKPSLNNSIMGKNSLMSNKIKSLETTNSRNKNYIIQNNINPNQNKNISLNIEKTKINLNTKKFGNKKMIKKIAYYTIDDNSHKKLDNKDMDLRVVGRDRQPVFIRMRFRLKEADIDHIRAKGLQMRWIEKETGQI